ncbi:MAG: prohibitin family protein [Verrucomicrobiota bacterium]
MSPQNIARLVGGAILLFCIVLMAASGTYVVHPGFRGVEVTMGKVSTAFKPEGFGLKAPFVTTIHPTSIKQQTAEDKAECYSSDLQQIQIELRVLFRIPESSVVKLFQDYYGDPFESLIAPRVHEAIKEATASQSAEQVVKSREIIKARALELARKKIGTLLVIEDIVIQNIALTKELENAIEAKMVQEQEAAKSKYFQQRAQIDADTSVIKAKGEAESIRIRGRALKENPTYIDLQIVDKWDGLAPMVIGSGANNVLTMQDLERLKQSERKVVSKPLENSPVIPRTKPTLKP